MALKNSELIKQIEDLIKKYNKKPEKKIKKKEIVELFQKTKILVPCRSDFEESHIHNELFDSVLFKPDIVKDGGKTRLLPVFTSYEQIPIDYMEKFSLVRMEATVAYDFMNVSEQIDGIVINPFTDANLELRKKSSKSSTRSYVKSTPKQENSSDAKALIVYDNQKYSIVKSPFTIGRDGTDIEIPRSYISKIHAIISYKDGKYRIADYESTNGTRLNKKELKPKVYYELRDGYEIELSDKEKLIFYLN